VASGTARGLLLRSEAIRGALTALAPSPVGDRLVAPIAGDETGSVRWTLEPKVGGVRPRHFDARLRADCVEFLVALHRTPVGRGGFAAPAEEAAALRPWLAHRERAVLERVSARLGRRLVDVARGWSHGDFWPGNLLVRRGRLAHVLDWDAAATDGLPLLDLLHLIAYGKRSLRRLPHGLRCVRALWPLAAAGGSPDIRRYCAATATPADADTLEALAIAYWLGRVARDLRTFADRPHRPQWMADNVHRPLAELEMRGW
jgi:aminoglycoside phosphotransferase (APT) family kinase protein